LGYGCKKPDVFYNIYIVTGGKVMGKPKAVNKQIAHGMIRFDAKAGQKFIALIVNWGDTGVETDALITTYAEKGEAKLS
jgi:nitrogenase subunit NifH